MHAFFKTCLVLAECVPWQLVTIILVVPRIYASSGQFYPSDSVTSHGPKLPDSQNYPLQQAMSMMRMVRRYLSTVNVDKLDHRHELSQQRQDDR
ncbi:hypothetical protein V1523DRAFT_427968 [Lipomyces doorenjongii]